MTRMGEALRYLKDVVLPYKGDDCLIWPYSCDGSGYGKIVIERRFYRVSRLACVEVNGEPPTPKHCAAHSCGKGHLGCVNPLHMRWATTQENMLDKIGHGTILRGEKCIWASLTESDVREIRALKDTILQADLAQRFGVAQTTISKIQKRQRWAWLPEMEPT